MASLSAVLVTFTQPEPNNTKWKIPKVNNSYLQNNFYYSPVLVSVLWLWKDTMSKSTYERMHLIEGLSTVWEGEPMTIMTGNMAAGR